MSDTRKYSPSFERNIAPITEKLKDILPDKQGALLEIGSGSGQHAVHLAKAFPIIVFQPTEYSQEELPSIEAWREDFGLPNVLAAKYLDVTATDWDLPEAHFSVLTAFNVIHYAPWAVTGALFANAGRYLAKNAQIIFYGPYRQNGAHTSESNAEFELWLKSINPEFGVRAIEDVEAIANRHGYRLEAFHPMPANNFMPEFVRL